MPTEILKEVIEAYPEILLEAFNSCLREGRFFVDWKKQRLILLRKGNKPLRDASSYRPIYLLDTMGMLLEELNLQRLQALLVWANALQKHAIQRRLFSAQRSVALRIVSAYRTVSMSAVLVLASVPPIDLLAEARQETFQLRKELTCTDLQEIARAKEAILKDGRRRLVEKWQMRWHGEQTGR